MQIEELTNVITQGDYGTAVSWRRPGVLPHLGAGDAHIWRVRLPVTPRVYTSIQRTLSIEERGRASRHTLEDNRKRFVVGRGMLRSILGFYLDVDASDIAIGYGSQGKPTLKENRHPGISFNLSHSGDWIVCAVSRALAIGVDVEFIRPSMDFDAIAKFIFSPTEQVKLQRSPADVKQKAFFNAWTRKEAMIKALGRGLFTPRPVDGEGWNRAERKTHFLQKPDPKYQWSICNLNIAQDYAGTLAISGKLRKLRRLEWPLPPGIRRFPR